MMFHDVLCFKIFEFSIAGLYNDATSLGLGVSMIWQHMHNSYLRKTVGSFFLDTV